MKKKKWLIPVVIIMAILVLVIASIGVIAVKGWSISTGRYLEAKNETGMLILDNSPITMSDRRDCDFFDNLDTGDKILVIHDGIAESYPS